MMSFYQLKEELWSNCKERLLQLIKITHITEGYMDSATHIHLKVLYDYEY
jgi:hypothetical protein